MKNSKKSVANKKSTGNEKSVIYIATNQSMPGLVKIGMTGKDDILERLKGLDNTSTPLPFECYYAVKVPSGVVSDIEKQMHNGLGEKRIRKNKEFFEISPEAAKSLLKIAELMGGKNVTPEEGSTVESEEDKRAIKRVRKTRSNFNFSMLNIEKGTKLFFKKNPAYDCEVENDTKVKFRDEITSLSKSAKTILEELNYETTDVAGPSYWCLRAHGDDLYTMRLENEDT